MEIKELVSWKSHWKVEKFLSEEAFSQGLPDEVIEYDGNVGLNEGIGEALDLMCGLGTPTAFDNTHAYLGVGSDANTASASQTGLLASTEKAYIGMESAYPARTDQAVSWRSVFGSSDANFAWNEFTVANGNSNSAKNLNRYVPTVSPGTKGSGSTWTLTLTITMS
jgi:hypothetical protein